MKTFTLAQLTEGVSTRKMSADAPRLLKKWGATSLLDGLKGVQAEGMARLLENQAAQLLLQESNGISTGGASLTSSGQIAGFSNVAFPIVRKVFAGLIANEIVSVQPMSLPSGLLFYLDYTYGSNVGGDAGLSLSNSSTVNTYTRGDSVYQSPVGRNVRSGSLAVGGQFDLVGTGFSKVHKQGLNLNGSVDSVGYWLSGSTWTTGSAAAVKSSADYVGYNARFVNFDSGVENGLTNNDFDYVFVHVSASEFSTKIVGTDFRDLDQIAITGFGSAANSAAAWGSTFQGGTGVLNLRKLNKRGDWNWSTGIFTPNAIGGSHVQFVVKIANAGTSPQPAGSASTSVTASAAISDVLSVNSDGSTLTIPSFETDFAIDASPRIPEIDIKIDSVAVTAVTRKLRARWSPEMAQDLTAFYSIDVEVELTNILSETVTLDIDREILNNILTEASAANLYWSRAPGRVVNKYTGAEALHNNVLSPGPQFFGNVREWYETLMETITDVANTIHKKTLRGSGNFIVTSPDVATIFEHLVAYKPAYKIDSDGQVKDSMSIGAEAIGTLNNRYVVYKDPYFPANKILIGLKGNTFLESGYIYAPYVPLILTPVVYAQEDFTPRKGIMSRYGTRMINSSYYGSITILDMSLI